MKKIKVYLDDWRIAPDGWVQAWNIDELVSLFEDTTIEITHLSLDHDLGVDEHNKVLPDGYDFVKLFVDRNFFCRKVYFHSASPIGKENMILYMVNAQENGAISKEIRIVKVGYPKSTQNKGNVFNDSF